MDILLAMVPSPAFNRALRFSCRFFKCFCRRSHSLLVMIRSKSTSRAGRTVSTRITLNRPPRPIKWPKSPIAAVVDIKCMIYPARMMMVPDVNMDGQDSIRASIHASFLGRLLRADT